MGDPTQDSLTHRLPWADKNQPQERGAPISYQPRLGVMRDHDTHHTSSIFVVKSTSCMTQTKRTLKSHFVFVVPCLSPGTLLFLFTLSKKSAFSFKSLNKVFQRCAELGYKHCRKVFFKPDVEAVLSPNSLQIKLHRLYVGSLTSHLAHATAAL